MVVPKTNRKRTRRRRLEGQPMMGYTPPQWRRFIIAGATVCHCIQALAQSSQLPPGKEEDEHDSA